MTDEQALELSMYQAIQVKKVKQLYQVFNYMEPKDHTAQKDRHLWISGPPNCGKSYYLDHIEGKQFQIPYNNDWSGYSGE